MVSPFVTEGKAYRLALVVRYVIHPGGTDGPVTPLVTCPEFEQRLDRFDHPLDRRLGLLQ